MRWIAIQVGKGLFCFLAFEPEVDLIFEQGQRQDAVAQNLIVEDFEIEGVAELVLGFVAQLDDFEFADFVGQGFTGAGEVAVDFDGGFFL